MERSLKAAAELLEILLNFMLILGMETVADAAFGGLSVPVYVLLIPLIAPLVFYAARKWCKNLLLFLVIHAAVIAALNYLGGFLAVPVLWKLVFSAIGVIYMILSLKIRLTRREDGEGEASAGFMAAAAVALFFGCSRLGSTAGCARILWLALLWLPGHWLKAYLENFLDYMKMNRRAAGAMPERRIFKGGVLLVALYSGFCLAILALYSKTALVEQLSGLVRKAGFWLMKLLIGLLMLFYGGEEEEVVSSVSEGASDPEMFLPAAEEAPLWMQILDKLLVTAVAILIIAGLAAAAILLIRLMIQRFYGREKAKKEICQEGFVEEEERLEKKKGGHGRRIPVIGGTPAQRIRRIFKKTVQETWKQCNAVSGASSETVRALSAATCISSAKTARELADRCRIASGQDAGDWEAITDLYEKARYTEETMTKEEVREAVRLSGRILRHGPC